VNEDGGKVCVAFIGKQLQQDLMDKKIELCLITAPINKLQYFNQKGILLFQVTLNKPDGER